MGVKRLVGCMVWGFVSSFCFYHGSSGVLSGMPACVPFLVVFIWALCFLVFVPLQIGVSKVGGYLCVLAFFFFCAVRAYSY